MRRLVLILTAFTAACLLAAPLVAAELVIDRRAEWQTWTIPQGVLDLGGDGSLRMRRFEGRRDPLLDMHEFEHETRESGNVFGGIRVGSGAGSVGNLLDRDATTWWQPDPGDGIDRWVLTIDLGRLELVESLRLVFPDTTVDGAAARPLRHFTVYVSEGMPIWDGRDQISYRQVYSTILGNRERVIDIPLFTRDPISGRSQAVGDNIVNADSLAFKPVQYIRIVPREMTAGAALAEIEAVSVGENIAPGTFGRGGSIRSSEKFQRTAPNMFDGTVEKFWLASAAKAAEREWQVGGQYFEWDLGVSFWLDQIVVYAWPPTDLAQTNFLAGSGPIGYEIELSDGSPISFAAGDRQFRGPFDYERLTLVDNQATPRRWMFQHLFPATKTRYLFYHHFNWGRDGGWGYKIWETFLYAPGHPAQVQISSDMIDLRGVRNLQSISWDADLPEGTRVEVRTKSGDEIGQKTLYFDRNGGEVTAERYHNVLKSFQRGDTLNVPFEGDDWSSWSDPYKVSGEAFKSPSPRGFVRFQLSLLTDDPEVTPVLRSLTLTHDAPLFQQAVEAAVTPREGPVGQWAEYIYTIRRPLFRGGDAGYDGFVLPLAVPIRDVEVVLRGQVVADAVTEVADDTLRVQLPQRVLRDSLQVRFSARLLQNPTFMDGFLTNSDQAGVTQGVKPARDVGNDALAVFLPGLSGSGALIANVSSGAGTVTPNDDGVNDELTLTFDLLKVDVAPVVKVYDVGGRLVRTLTGQAGALQQTIPWDGRDEQLNRVPPGIYLCRIEVEAGVGTRSVTEVIHVAY